MAFAPVAYIIPQYEKAKFKNWWLKAYEQGTTTPKVIATDSTGGTTASRIELNSEGFPETAGGSRFIPFIDGSYDLWAFPTAAEADANDTTNAYQFADNINALAADLKSYNSGATGAVDRTINSRLAEITSIQDFGVTGDGVTDDTTEATAFFTHMAANGGVGVINVPIRVTPIVVTSNAKPFTIIFSDRDAVISANSKASPLSFVTCSGVTLVRPNVNGRAAAQGALLESDGIYHGIVWEDCSDMYCYQPYIEDYNGSAMLVYKASTAPQRNFVIDGYADAKGVGENRNGFILVDCEDSELINCQATGAVSFGLELKNASVNCAIRGGKVTNTGIATGCGQTGATGPGVGGVKDSVIEGVIVENCDQAYAGGFARNVHVDLPVVDLRVLPGHVGADFGFRINDSEECSIRFRQFMGDVEVAQFWTNAKKNSAIVDNMESEAGTFVDFIAGTEDNSIEIKRATADNAGTVTEYDFLRNKVTDSGTNNSFEYKGGDTRKASQEVIRYASSTSVTIDGATSTGNQDIIDPIFSVRANEFEQEGDEIIVELSGEFVGAGTNKRLFLYFGGSQIAFVVSGIATTQAFECQFRIASRGASSQVWATKLAINGQTLDVERGTTSVSSSAGFDLALQGRLDAGAGNTITVDRCVAKIIRNGT